MVQVVGLRARGEVALRERVVISEHRVDVQPGLGEDRGDDVGVDADQADDDVLVEVSVARVDRVVSEWKRTIVGTK